MLVLSRKVGERILIGENIWLEVVEIQPWCGKVRLGIVAPKEVPVHRQEVYEAIQREKEKSNGGRRDSGVADSGVRGAEVKSGADAPGGGSPGERGDKERPGDKHSANNPVGDAGDIPGDRGKGK